MDLKTEAEAMEWRLACDGKTQSADIVHRLRTALAEAQRELESYKGLSPYQIGYIDAREDARAAVGALAERFAKLAHLATIEDALEYAEKEAAGEVGEGRKRETALAAAELERDELRAAAATVVKAFDDRVFIRSTEGDSDPAWGIRMLKPIAALGVLAKSAIREARRGE